MEVGLVGCGNWGRHILRDLLALGCDVTVVARSAASSERARSGGARRIVPTAEALDGVAGIVVATPTTTHAEVVGRVLGHGVPVFVEKPLCDDPDAAARLARLAPDHLFVMDKWRYHRGVLTIAELTRSGSLGPVRGLKTLRLGWGSTQKDCDAAWHLAPHDVSIAREVLGRSLEPVAALAETTDGHAVSLVGLLSGDGAWHALEVSERSPSRIRRVELHCDEGVVVLAGGWDDFVTVYRDGPGEPEAERIDTPGELPLLAELRAFVEHLGGGPPPRSNAADGASTVATIAQLRSLAGL